MRLRLAQRELLPAPLYAPLALALTCSAALAAPTVIVSPTMGHPKLATQVSGTGFGANEAVDIYFDTTDEILDVTNGSGNFGFDKLKIPAGAEPGSHWITAIGRHTGDAAHVAFIVTTPWFSHGYDARGHRRNPYENVIDPSNAGNLELAWSTSISGSAIFSAPAVYSVGSAYNPYIFIGSEDHKLYAVNASGTVKWSAATGGPIDSSPAIGPNATVYVGSEDHKLYAFKAATGVAAWSSPATTGGNIDSSPAVANGIVYVGSNDGKLYAFNAATGASAWAAPATLSGSPDYNSPAVADGGVYIGANDGKVYGFNAQTGAALWTPVPTGASIEASSPAAANGFVYLGSLDGKLYAINDRSGGVAWTHTTGATIYSSPAVANGTVYFGSDDGSLYALRAGDGVLRWSVYLGGGMGVCSPAVANGVVYICTNGNAQMHAVDASNGTVLWSAAADADYSIDSSPTVTDGVLYFPDLAGNLYAYALDAGNNPAYRHKHAQPPSYASLHPDFRLKPIK